MFDELYRMMIKGSALGLFAFVVCLTSCAPPSVRAHAVAPLNVNLVNESTPVDVRFFELSDDQPFITTPFETLWLEAPKVLGNTLQGPVLTRTLFPGTVSDPPITLVLEDFAQQTRFLGILALFRSSDGTPRQLVIPVEQLNHHILELRGSTVWVGECPLPPPQKTQAATNNAGASP